MPKKIISIIIFLSCSFLNAQEKVTLREVENFGFNPGNLKLFTHISEGNDSLKRPLVVVLHGCSQTAKDAAALSGWNKLADLHNFIVIYPQQKMLNNPQMCFNWFNPDDVDKGKGECESIYTMIEYIRNTYKIDSSKIFITGMSAGAAMSNAMMATHPELFNAGALLAGGAYKIAENSFEALAVMTGKKDVAWQKLTDDVKDQNYFYKGRYPKVLIYQGDKDPIVKPINAKYIIYQWTSVNKTDTIADVANKAYKGIEAITRYEYQNKNKEVVVVYYSIKDVGHKLLIKPGDAPDEGGKKGIFSEELGYHSTYYIAREFGLIKK